jgi:hypothetical protein
VRRRGLAIEHTLAGRWNQSGDHSEFIVSVHEVDAVPTGLSDCRSRRWARGSLEVTEASRSKVGAEGGLHVGERGAGRHGS